MKKKYLEPTILIMTVNTVTILANSPEVTSNKDIGYGGVDKNGSLDPASRRRKDQWEDEEEDESF